MPGTPGFPGQPHECAFVLPAHDGTPAPCSCGKTYAQQQADLQYEQACAAVAAAYPLPDVDFLSAGAGDEMHAVPRAHAVEWTARQGREPAVLAVCGQTAILTAEQDAYGTGTRLHALPRCPGCAWHVAAARGTLAGQVQTLVPYPEERAILAGLLPDPLIAAATAEKLIAAAGVGPGGFDPEESGLVQLLVAVDRHRPVILVSGECTDGECQDCPGSSGTGRCLSRDAYAACRECSLQAGPWAGELEGRFFLTACRIGAPCEILRSIARYAEDRSRPAWADVPPPGGEPASWG